MTRRGTLLALLAPDELAERVADIDLARLREHGFEGLILDVDNTLTPWASCEMDEATEAWVRQAKQEFRVCLLSNSVRGKRMRALAEKLDLPGVSAWGIGRKPLRRGFLRALSATGTAPEKTVMVGDQLLADVLGGNRLGMHTIWVKRIRKREFITTRVGRVLERLCAERVRRAGFMPERQRTTANDG